MSHRPLRPVSPLARQSLAAGVAVPSHDPHVNLEVGPFVFLASPHAEGLQEGELGMNGLQRKCGAFTLGQALNVKVFVPSADVALAEISIQVDTLVKKAGAPPVTIDCDELSEAFKAQFGNQVFCVRQQLAMDFNGLKLDLIIDSFEHADLSDDSKSYRPRGQVLQVTNVSFKRMVGSTSTLIFTGSNGPSRNENLFKKDFNFDSMGIGGLDEQFKTIFRRAFASRIFPGLTKQLGMNHVKGILLYGPPGCGKTLIARQIGKILNAREPKIINGPEVLDKYVGGSEEKIRKLQYFEVFHV